MWYHSTPKPGIHQPNGADEVLHFSNIPQARYCLTDLMGQCLKLTRTVGLDRVAPPVHIHEKQMKEQRRLHDLYANGIFSSDKMP
jgi:hypothetical protein